MDIITTPITNHSSLVSLFLSLLNGKLQPNSYWNSKKFRAKFAFRSLIYPITTYNYFNKLLKLQVLPKLLLIHGLLPAKPHRPYLSTYFNAAQRAQAIIDHYTLMSELNNASLSQLLQSSRDNLLANFFGKNNEPFLLHCCPGRFDREGEVTLELRYETLLITSLSFSIIRENQERMLMIGGLQGPRKHISRDVIRNATKAMYGIFPKYLLMETVFILAELCNVKKICAVSDAAHVLRSFRYIKRKNHELLANYSEFWQSLGGKLRKDNLYELPLNIKHKSLENIPSKKRSEYRRRYALLDTVSKQIYHASGIKNPSCKKITND